MDPKEAAEVFKKIALLGTPAPPEPLWAALPAQAQLDYVQEFARYTEYSLPHLPRAGKVLLVQWLLGQQGYTTLGARGLNDSVDVALQGHKSQTRLLARVWLPAHIAVPVELPQEFLTDLQSTGLTRGIVLAFSRFAQKPKALRQPALRVDWLAGQDIYALLQKHLAAQRPAAPAATPPAIAQPTPDYQPVILHERPEPTLLRELPEPSPQPVAPPPATPATPSAMQIELATLQSLWPQLTPRDRDELLEIARLKIRLRG